MKDLFRAILPLVFLGAMALPGADFWEKKKFPDWTQKEAQRMLSNSPWARGVELRLGFPSGGTMGRRGGGGIPGPPGGGGGGGMGAEGPGGEGAGMPRGGGFPGADVPPALTVTVRWQSALPVRQALAKTRFGEEALTSPEAAQLLAAQPEHYIVAVVGLPPPALRGDPARLKSAALLKLKDEPPIEAADLKGSRDQDGIDLYLFFPKAQQGARLIALEDSEVEFILKLGPSDIKRKFKLKEMIYEGKLEL